MIPRATPGGSSRAGFSMKRTSLDMAAAAVGSVDEAIAQFEKRFHVREDPDAGVWRRVAAAPEKGARHGGDA